MRKGVLLQQGAMPAVCAEARAFEAPHEKCQNMQRISLNHRGLKSAQVILRGHSLPLPGGREEQSLVPSGSGLGKASSAMTGQSEQP